MREVLSIWVVYWDTLDFPKKFVARRFDDEMPTNDICVCDYIDDAHEWLYRQMPLYHGIGARMAPDPNDDPKILEVWL